MMEKEECTLEWPMGDQLFINFVFHFTVDSLFLLRGKFFDVLKNIID